MALVTEAHTARSDVLRHREFGVLLHLTSLPGATEWGALGRAADHFLDWLTLAGAGVWQVLPLGPVGEDGSPYYARSTHAGNPRLIDVEALGGGAGHLLQRGDEPFRTWHARVLGAAAQAVVAGGAPEFLAWMTAQSFWLDDYTLSVALAEEQATSAWWQWPAALRDREAGALETARKRHAARRREVAAEQYLFHRQWRDLRTRAAARGIRLFGDLPMYLAPDAVDVWVHRDLFELDATGRPTSVAGVPPDYFAVDGQRWGNPVYRWSEHRRTGFAWWLERLGAELELCDFVRLDHFRALESYWAIPAGASARDGSWRPAAGADLLTAARDRFGSLPIVAEDLGVITPPVDALRDAFALPGMRVLQFGFDGDASNVHLPHNWHGDVVAYTGTHDNDTLAGWLGGLDPETRGRVRAYVGSDMLQEGLLRILFGSVARLTVVPMQDLAGLGNEARMNVPGTVGDNWRWQLDWATVPPDLASRTRALGARYARVRPT